MRGRRVAADFGAIGGGIDNRVVGSHGTVAGGASNAAGSGGAVGGGNNNTASSFNATVPGGFGNTASGDSSVAMGAHALADQARCLVFRGWDDNVSSGSCLNTPWIARFFANNGLSVDYFTPGPGGRGTRWVDIGGFPKPTIATCPTAQDFKAAFDVGINDKTIATVDADGVALAAIQG